MKKLKTVKKLSKEDKQIKEFVKKNHIKKVRMVEFKEKDMIKLCKAITKGFELIHKAHNKMIDAAEFLIG